MGLIRYVVALVVLFSMTEIVAAQPCTPARYRTWLRVSDGGTGRDTLWFGFDSTGTYGLNTPLCEYELPPIPPAGVFDTRWVNIPGMEGTEPPAGMGQGFRLDFRRYTTPGRIDTHKVFFQPNVPPGFPMTLRWSIPGLAAICDSARLVDEFGGFFYNVRMQTIDSVRVVASPPIQNLLLIRFGARLTDVREIGNGLPHSFGLEQNYPNPFNPTTTIRFGLEQRARTEVSVYDVVGRRISVLVSRDMAPGFYEAEWNGKNESGLSAASGVYFVRMNATTDQGASFTATRKIVLMK